MVPAAVLWPEVGVTQHPAAGGVAAVDGASSRLRAVPCRLLALSQGVQKLHVPRAGDLQKSALLSF